MERYAPPEYTVKITVTGYKSYHVEETVYYRYKVPFDHVVRYRWYFDWLAALIKAKHPHRTVTLEVIRRNENSVKCGKEFLQEAIPNKIKGIRAKMTAEKNKAARNADLFGLAAAESEERIAAYRHRIEALERGEYDGWVPPTYINNVKKWILPEK